MTTTTTIDTGPARLAISNDDHSTFRFPTAYGCRQCQYCQRTATLFIFYSG